MDEKQKKTVMMGVGAGLAIVLALVSMYLFVIAPSMKSDEDTGDTGDSGANVAANAGTPSVGPGTYPAPPGYGPVTGGTAPGMPGATGAVTGSETEKAVNLPPVERSRKDPFAPLIPPPPPPPDWQVLAAGLPPISIAKPPDRLASAQSSADMAMPDVGTEVARRVAGLVTGKRAFALVEQEGQTFIVRPGDVLPPDLAVVERIEPGRVLLRRAGKPIWLPLQASSETTAVTGAPVTTPGGYPGGGYPGASRPGYSPYGPPGPPGMYRRSGG